MSIKIYIDGKYFDKKDACVSVFDHGLLYGDGVFEGIRSYNNIVFKLKEHIDRLYNSAKLIRLKITISKSQMKKDIIATLKKNKLKDAYIRLIITRGPGDLGLDPRKCKKSVIIIIADRISLYPQEYYDKGLKIITAKTRANLPEALNPKIKSLNYLNNILGRIDAIDCDAQEAIMLTYDGYVTECTGDNLFIVKNQRLITPPCSLGALEGITRQAVLDIAKKLGIPALERKMKLVDIYNSQECFLTGTAAEIIPVVNVDKKKIGAGVPGSVTKIFIDNFRELTRRSGVRYEL